MSIGNVDYWSARVVWKMVTGADPVGTIDFRNGDTTDLRWHNLRELTPAQRRLVRGPGVNNTSGVAGVSRAGPGRWRATLWRGRVRVHLGYFRTLGAARAARRRAVRRLLRGG